MKNSLMILGTLMVSACGMEVVDTGHRGLHIRFGEVSDAPLPEGLHFYNPVTSTIKEFNVQESKLEASTQAFTKDTQVVTIKFAVNYYPDTSEVVKLYRQFGMAWAEKTVEPAVLASMKDSIGQVNADDLVNNRQKITQSAETHIKDTLKERGIIVTQVFFTNLDFEDQYEQAVELKVVAIQNAITAKNKTVQILEEAKQTVATAQAQAEAMKIKSQALAQNKGLVEFEAVQKWNGVLPQNVYGSAPIPFLNLSK